MRRLLTWLLVLPALLAVVVFALNNKVPIALDLWPSGYVVEMPAFLALFIALGLGVVLGGLVAWLGQGRVRAKLREEAYEGEVARRELKAEKDKAQTLQHVAPPSSTTALVPSSEAARQVTLPPTAA